MAEKPVDPFADEDGVTYNEAFDQSFVEGGDDEFDEYWMNEDEIESASTDQLSTSTSTVATVELDDPPPQADVYVDNEEQVEVEEVDRESDVRRTTHAAQQTNPLDFKYTLPIIDSHCHIGGKSLSGAQAMKGLTRGVGRATTLSFLYYNGSPDNALSDKLVNSLTHFCRTIGHGDSASRPVAAVAQVLDMGYVALGRDMLTMVGRATGASMKRREVEVLKAAEDFIYTHPDDKDKKFAIKRGGWKYSFVWFPRDDQTWKDALTKCEFACWAHPCKVWPFVGFDPRRATGFDIAKQRVESGAWVGVKFYSRTGWMPIHNRRIYGNTVGDKLDAECTKLYTWLEQQQVPCLVHCSPTGFPPDNWFVLPYTFTDKRLKGGFVVQGDGGTPSPHGYGNVIDAPWPPYFPRKQCKSLNVVERNLMRFASLLAYHCVYNQMTTSPYSWEPVLEKHPNLRLCLAHFGAEIGGYATPYRAVPVEDDWSENIERHPWVSGTYGKAAWDAKGLPHRDFRALFKKGVLHLLRDHCKKGSRLPGKVERAIAGGMLESNAHWKKWFEDWEAAYPKSWHDKIHDMIARGDRPNLYTDISYLTCNARMFPIALGPIVNEAIEGADARGKALRKKVMVGTDWFMIEMDSWSPRKFFTAVHDTFFPRINFDDRRDALWKRWVSQNALNWLNLKPRLNNTGMDIMKTFYKDGDAPGAPSNAGQVAESRTFDKVTWKAIERYYDKGNHTAEPVFPAAPTQDDWVR
jgi:predicted TIM-barrel fold metal-dependent hydrolase